MNIIQENDYTEAVIYLKDGARKHGVLLENIINDAYHFISNTNYKNFKKDNNQAYIEIVPCNLIEIIDTSLK